MPTNASWGKTALAAVATVAVTYVAACAFIQPPQPTFAPVDPENATIVLGGEAPQALVDAYSAPTAVGWLDGGSGADIADGADAADDADDAIWANDDAPHPLASITKLVTALVGQERDPLRAGEAGPRYTWTESDSEFQTELLAEDGIAFPIPVGTEVTRLEMLRLALVPSANDFATAYAHSLFSDDAGFAAAVETWATSHGLDSLTVVEPSGMDDRNVASAADVVRLARLALGDPVIAELVRTEHVPIPAASGAETLEVENTNPLLSTQPGVIGVKTGHTEAAGFSLAVAARSTVAERELTAIAVVLNRESEEQRTADAAELLDSLATLPEQRAVATAGDSLGELRSVTGERRRITAADTHTEVLVPGERVTTVFDAGGPALIVSGPGGAYDVPVHGADALPGPTLWWRLTHPAELFFAR